MSDRRQRPRAAAPSWTRRVRRRQRPAIGWRGWASALAVVALLPALTTCDRSKAKEAGPPPPPPPSVLVAEVTQRTVPIVSEFVAQTDAVQTVELRARVQGVLEKVLFKEGADVQGGQPLFEIERTQYDAALQSARAELAKAQADLAKAQEQVEVLRARAELEKVRSDLTRAEDRVTVVRAEAGLAQKQASLAKAQADVARFRPLVEVKAVPKQDLDNALASQDVATADVQAARAALQDTELGFRVGIQVAKANVAAAEAKLKDTELSERIGVQQAQAAVEAARASVTQAQLNLDYTTIRAPVSGIIGRLAVNEGNLVGRGESTLLATMSTYDPIKVVATLSEADYLRFARRAAERKFGEGSSSLEMILADGTVYPLRGRAITLDRTVDPKTGTIVIEAQFPNPDKLLRPGQFGRVRAVVEERANAILVPQSAIQEVQGAKSVLVVGSDSKVALRTVTLAERIGELIIVSRGLEPGERVIVEGVQKARPGMAVKAETAPPPGPAAPAPGGAAPPAPGGVAPPAPAGAAPPAPGGAAPPPPAGAAPPAPGGAAPPPPAGAAPPAPGRPAAPAGKQPAGKQPAGG